ncbi:necdin-like 2 isoform X3 [Xiphophorus couchianus]|uniref:necdin-like 2 isoform X3 n=1 Tax=Xiphophorus couchianus TaxID=32473 RepID=UPI0010161034|nr:non-structural maintenance of chromosomes element 3 homolog isoform X3 [Xiphophorus couchianus]XP_032422502.1 non-structural maintenance of chromosomes element 3 homolog isoform X2 [Xiphophorus hellerii]
MTQRKRLSNVQSSSQSKRQSNSFMTQEEDEDATFTQPSTSQVQRGLEKLTAAQVDQKTAEVVQYILVKDQKKIPVRRADLVKHVIKDYRTVYPEIIKRAMQTFEQVFGLKLVEIDSKNHMYVLVNNLDASTARPSPVERPSNPKMGLLFVILSVIFMKGGVVRENLMWNTLKKLRVDPGYLEYVRVPHTEPVEYEFRWGQRSDMEVSKAQILEFMGQLLEQDPQSWTQQYREAHSTASSSQASSSNHR